MTEKDHMVPLVCTCSSFHLWYSYLAQSSTGHTRVSDGSAGSWGRMAERAPDTRPFSHLEG